MQAPVSDLDLVVKLSLQVKWRPRGASGQCVITSVHISYRDAPEQALTQLKTETKQ